MDERDRIEIELTSLDRSASPPDTSFARSATEAAGTATVMGSERPPSAFDRAALLAIFGVGVIALALGWALGRSNGGSNAAPVVTPVAQTVPISSEPAIVTLPAPTETTTPPPLLVAPSDVPSEEDQAPAGNPVPVDMHVAPELLGQELEFIVYGNGRRLSYLDLATGDGVERLVERQPFGPPVLHVAADWVLIPTFQSGLPSLYIAGDELPTEVDIGPAWALVGVEGDTLWRADSASTAADESQVQRISPTGEPVSEVMTVPFVPRAVDPGGGLLTLAPGGVYQVGVGEPRRITSGDLMALSAVAAVAFECDAALACDVVNIDRLTGERTVIDIAALAGPVGGELRELPLAQSISPDGATAVFAIRSLSGTGQEVLFALDLPTGSVTPIGIAQQTGRLAWTPDSRYVIFVRGGRLTAFDMVDNTVFNVSDDLFAVETFEVRSPSGE